MQQQLSELPPDIQIKEVQVIPPEIQEELDRLRAEIRVLARDYSSVTEGFKASCQQLSEKTQEVEALQCNLQSLTEEYEKALKEKEILANTANSLLKKNRELNGKLSSLHSLKEQFCNEYDRLCGIGMVVIESTAITADLEGT